MNITVDLNMRFAALIEVTQMPEVHVTLVKEDDFATLDSGAQFSCPLVVVLARRVDDGELVSGWLF